MIPLYVLDISLLELRRQVSRNRLELTIGEGQSAERRPALTRPEIAGGSGVGTIQDPFDADLANPFYRQGSVGRRDVEVGDGGNVEPEPPGARIVLWTAWASTAMALSAGGSS